MRYSKLLIAATLFLPASGFGASKEIQELQRDLAQLQQQIQTLQSTSDQRLSAIQVLVQQALDAGNKANTGVSVLSSNMNQTLERQLSQSLTPVTALSAKIENTNNDVSEVRNQVTELNNSVNKVLQLLNDMNNAMKVMQVPAAPPPGPVPSNSAMPPAASSGPPPVAASALFGNAARDQNGGKLDLALQEYADFIKYYPDDPNAAGAQLNIGEIHYAQNHLEAAVKDFDAVIERYSDNVKVTPDAYFMKGMALKQGARKAEAASTFRSLVAKFPRSDRAVQAQEQLRAMGFTLAAAPPAAAPRRRR